MKRTLLHRSIAIGNTTGPRLARTGRRGWRALRRVVARTGRHRATLLAAGVAFYALLAVVPALVAVLSLFGLLTDPETVRRQVTESLDSLPLEVRTFIASQLGDVSASSNGAAITSVVLGVLVALWSASGGVGHLLAAIEVANGDVERRGMVRRRGAALLVTFGAVVFVVLALIVLTVLPSLLTALDIGGGGVALRLATWALLLVGMINGLSVLYRIGRPQGRPDRSWLHPSPGALVATSMWLLGSVGFSIYVENFAEYNQLYGSLGAVIVMLLWLFLSAFAVIFGAEIDADRRRHREVAASDTTFTETVTPPDDAGDADDEER